MAELWTLLTENPATFKGGGIWRIMTNINDALTAIAYGLLVLFFAAGIIKTCGSFTDIKKPEHVLKAFIRFALAQGAITYGMELMQALFSIVQGIVTTVMSGSGMAGSVTELPTEIVDKIESVGMLESIPLWIVTLLGSLLITVLSFVMILTVYGRMFKIYMYTAIAPIPISSFAGEPTQSIGKNFLRSYVGVCLEGAIIALACIIYSAYAASPPAVGDTGLSAVTIVWNYVGELVFNLLVLVGAIKASDRIVNTNKTLGYDWEYGHEEVAIRVSSYRNNGNLYVGLCHREEGEWEDFGDVTINLPFSFLEPNEAYITGDFTKDMIRFIKAHKLGKVLDETAKSGYGTYQKVAFDLARLAEVDPEGVAEHCKMMGIELPREKPKKVKKQNRGKER